MNHGRVATTGESCAERGESESESESGLVAGVSSLTN
jgi:hypothetical protein